MDIFLTILAFVLLSVFFLKIIDSAKEFKMLKNNQKVIDDFWKVNHTFEGKT